MAPFEALSTLGRMLMLAGAVMLAIGVALVFAPKLPFLGRLPGDLVLGSDKVTVYFPIATMILVSVLLILALNLLPRLFK